MNYDIILSQHDGVVTADSRDIARHFEREHRHVLRAIDDLAEGLRKYSDTPCFFESFYVEPQNGQTYRKYDMTRDGFTLLVMGFTGNRALEWQLAYVKAFNKMERRLSQPSTTAEQLLQQAQFLVDTEKRLNKVEAEQLEMANKVDRIAAVAQPIGTDWQTEIETRVRFICKTYGYDYQEVHHQLYATLESRAHCNLAARKKNLKDRLAATGAKKTDINAVSTLATIAANPDLRDPYELIVRDWASYVETRA